MKCKRGFFKRKRKGVTKSKKSMKGSTGKGKHIIKVVDESLKSQDGG